MFSNLFISRIEIDYNSHQNLRANTPFSEQAFPQREKIITYNRKILEKLSSKSLKKNKNLSKATIENLVEQASVNVLGNLSPFLRGACKISNQHYQLIKKELAYQKAMYFSSINLAFLKNILLKKFSDSQEIGSLSHIEKLISGAAATVLGLPTLFQEGKILMSEKQSQQIEKEFDKIKTRISEKAKAKENYLTLTVLQYKEMVNSLRKDAAKIALDRQKPEFQALLDNYYQIMGCVISYGKWRIGDTILGPHQDLPNFKVQMMITNKRGLQIVVLVPDLSHSNNNAQDFLNPIFCCRGTTTNPHNFLDDFNYQIGQYSLNQESKTIIHEALKKMSGTRGAVITGHSLGGTISQLIAATFCDQLNEEGTPLIHSVYHYSAPGVGKTLADEYKTKIEKLKKEQRFRPQVYSFAHVRDPIPLAGGEHIQADIKKFVGNFSLLDVLFPRFILQAHSLQKFISEEEGGVFEEWTLSQRFSKSFIEKTRRLVSFIFRGVIEKQILVKQRLKQNSEKILNSLSHSAEAREAILREAIHQEDFLRKQQKKQRQHFAHILAHAMAYR